MNRMISGLPDLAQRVEKLEKANRRLKLAGVLALTLVGCLLLLGVASPKRIVEAEAFLLRDANGKGRAGHVWEIKEIVAMLDNLINKENLP